MKIKIAVIAVLVTSGFFFLNANEGLTKEQKQTIAEINQEVFLAPDFSLLGIDDVQYALSDLRGKVVLVNFWATWCPPCRMEIPEFNELYEKYKDQGFEILGVSMSDTKDKLLEFVKGQKMDYPILYGSKQDIGKISAEYGGIQSIPTSFIIGKKGDLIRIYPGAIIKGQQMYPYFINDIETALKVKYKE